ncbi:HupE/UreJ family protein [Thalassotalea litorea]|uniref:HupE/UreJ family protein n=1 Tax=Thalassotalea litorea TaxID=2020715 RepID=A0A5R9ISR4_9GAMM|nr:HupE/UreJ family protein [Thalassotalea litorea]TLU67543.1 HupE/UreJ family protein [Thalassotalea litorea]
MNHTYHQSNLRRYIAAQLKPPLLFLLAFWLIASAQVFAHESRPLYIKIIQHDKASYTLNWRSPQSLSWDNQPNILPPENCQFNQSKANITAAGIYQMQLRCDAFTDSDVFTIDYPFANPSISSLIDIQLLEQSKQTVLLGPEQKTWRLMSSKGSDKSWFAYGELGVKHIWMGIDHLLFVGCLIFFARGWRKLFWTITGFTLAHSITLGLSSLDIIRVNIIPIEAIIALSIIFLAVELTKPKDTTLTWRYPAIVAISFGLLHGFGFASVLSEIGLPEQDKILSLLFFNLGIEVGQLVFIALIFVIAWPFKNIARAKKSTEEVVDLSRYYRIAAYFIGPLAAFWFWQRLAQF